MKQQINYKKYNFHKKKNLFVKSIISALVITPLWLVADEEMATAETDDQIITVTAQKRKQNIMKVPVTVDSVYDELIKQSGSVMLSDLDKFIPGFEFSDGDVTQAGVTMRGISSPNISVGGDPSTAIFYDGIYMPRAAQNVLFSDMERIEVLKGPQGTLFGKNAAMGVVNMIPNAPDEEFDAFFKGALGTDNLQRFEGMVNLSLSDNVYLRINALSNLQDGFMKNVADSPVNSGEKVWDNGDKDHQAARIALKWETSSRTSIQFSFDWDKLDQAPGAAIGLSPYSEHSNNPFAETFANDVAHGGESRDMSALTFSIEHEFNEHWSMKFKSSSRQWETYNRIDEDGTQDIRRYLDTDNHEDSDIFYNELQVNYNSDRFNYVGGVTYSKENVHQTTFISTTTNSVARLVTDVINGEVRGQVTSGINQELATNGLVVLDDEGNITEGGYDADTAAAIAMCMGQGKDPSLCIGQVGYDDLVDATYGQMGLTPMTYMWDAEQWAATLTALGMPVDAATVLVANGTPFDTYNAAAQLFGDQTIFGPAYGAMIWSENFINNGKFTSFGLYSDIDFQLSDKWNVFFGIRYSKDKKDFSWAVSETQFASVRPGVSNVLFQPRAELWQSNSWSKTTGRIGAGYQINDKHMVFASYATGYKAGGYDSLNSPHNGDGEVLIDQTTGEVLDVSFKPEDSVNYELGYKGIIFDNVRTTLAIFHNNLDDRQVSKSSLHPDQDYALPTIVNEDVVNDGFELGMDWAVNEQFSAGFVTEIRTIDITTDAFYNDVGNYIEAGTTSTDTNTSYTLRADWIPDFEIGTTIIHIDYVYMENANESIIGADEWVNNIPHYFDDTKLLNMRISWINDDEQLEVGLWGRNLLDNRTVGTPGGRTKEVFGTGFTTVNKGLEAGIDVKFNF